MALLWRESWSKALGFASLEDMLKKWGLTPSLRFRYIFFENLLSWFIAIIVFLFITLIIQSFQLSQTILGAGVLVVLEALFYHCMVLSPVLLSVCLFFSIVFTYRKMSRDFEIVSLKNFGLSYWQIVKPTWCLSFIVFLMALQCSFYFSPWAEGQINEMEQSLLNSKPLTALNIREEVFSENFSDLVVYANAVDKSENSLKGVFIYDERNKDLPLTITAKKGQILSESMGLTLVLYDGKIYQTSEEGVSSRVDFKLNKFILPNFNFGLSGKKDRRAMIINELYESNESMGGGAISLEIHEKWAIPFTGLIFTLLALNLGMGVNRRNAKDPLLLALSFFIFYWILFAILNKFAANAPSDRAFLLWVPNIFFLALGFFEWKKKQKI